MNIVQYNSGVSVQEFRQASYYALFYRNRIGIIISIGSVAAAIVYSVLATFGFVPDTKLIYFIAGGSLLWLLLKFAATEHRIIKYIQSEQSMVGVPFQVEWGMTQLHISVPSRNTVIDTTFSKLFYAVELSNLFLIYLNSQELFILPTKGMTQRYVTDLRDVLSHHMGENFSSRYQFRKKG